MASRLEKWSWIAGIASAILAGIAFFGARSESSGPAISQTAGSGSTQIGSNSGTIVIGQTEGERLARLPVDIEGVWKIQSAETMAMTQLEAHDWSSTQFEKPLIHKILKESDLVYKDHESKVLTFTTVPRDFDCHVCAPYLSFFEFEKRVSGWKLTSSDIASVHDGSWGEFPADGLSVRVISDNIYGVFLEHGYTAQGFMNGSVSVYARLGDSFKDILDLNTMESDPDEYGGGSWSSTLEIKPVPTGLYEIVVHRKGGRGPQDLRWISGPEDRKENVADSDGKVRPLDNFQFDGVRYVRSDLYH